MSSELNVKTGASPGIEEVRSHSSTGLSRKRALDPKANVRIHKLLTCSKQITAADFDQIVSPRSLMSSLKL